MNEEIDSNVLTTMTAGIMISRDRNYMTFCYPKYVLFMTFKIAKYDVKKVKYDI